MPDIIRCPSCGQDNPAANDSCQACNFPLRPVGSPPPPAAREPEPPVVIERPLPYRPRPRPAASNQAMTLWLVFGALAAVVVIYIAFQSTLERRTPAAPVEGANVDAQKHADELRAALAQDSSNVDARQQLADILYDTANWNDAIVQYRSVVRQDSTRGTAIVDLGVCYYNLGYVDVAKEHFELGLKRDPNNAIALFNLGIVAEREKDLEGALKYYHRAVECNPPQNMMQAISDAVMRVGKQLGRTPPPLPNGGAGMPGSMPPQGMPGGTPPQGMPPSGR